MSQYHEKRLKDNDGNYFSWETSLAGLHSHLKERHKKITKKMNKGGVDFTVLSMASTILLLSFSLYAWFQQSSIELGITYSVTFAFSVWAVWKIHENSSYKTLVKLREISKNWKYE